MWPSTIYKIYKNTQIYKNYKKKQKVQNMNYGIYRYNKIKKMIFFDFPKNRKYFGILGVFVKQIAIFNIGFGFCVFNYMGT